MTDITARARSRVVLVAVSVLALLAIGILWPLAYPYEICVAIEPAPPGCQGGAPLSAVFVGIALVILLLAASFVVYFTVRDPWFALLSLAGAIVLVSVCSTVVALSQQALGWTIGWAP